MFCSGFGDDMARRLASKRCKTDGNAVFHETDTLIKY